MDIGMYNSYLEVDFGKMKESFRKVQAAAGKRGVIPVLKANAYGIGLIPMADFLVNTMGCEVMAVAQTSEGVQLRQGGFRQADIMLLGPAPLHAVPYAVENDLLLPVFNRENAQWINDEAKKQGKIARVQLKIDTGMNRIGVRHGEPLEELLDFTRIENGEVFLRKDEITWQCRNCGYIVEAEAAPKTCPACLFPQAYFEPMKENY